jgi:hypothetical protein
MFLPCTLQFLYMYMLFFYPKQLSLIIGTRITEIGGIDRPSCFGYHYASYIIRHIITTHSFLRMPLSLQETAKSTRVQITYESPLVSYVIYEGQCKRS